MSSARRELPPAARTIDALVAERAARAPDAIALLAPDRARLTYRGLAAVVEDVAEQLRGAGIEAGDRVALVTANGPLAVTSFLGIATAASAAPLNPAYRRDEIRFDLTDLRAKAVVVDAALDTPATEVAGELGIPVLTMTPVADGPAGSLRLDGGGHGSNGTVEFGGTGATTPAPPGTRPIADDIALVLHTSGTTARPKIVPLSHGRLVASARVVAATLELRERDRCLNVMPLFHIHGLVAAVLATLASGGSLVATPGFVGPSFFDWLDAFEPTWYTAVPTIHQAVLARTAGNLDVIARRPLRFIRSSSASLPVAVLEGLEAAFGAPVIEAYGMTEASHQMASNPLPPGVRKPGSVGRATGIEIAALDRDGHPVPNGEVGEIAIRGATVFDGYEANPEANAAAFVDGWFLTGDEGALDADGYLSLRGRLKELINRGGEKVAPVEVEEALLALPGVAQAVVFAMPDARLGEEVAAAVVPDAGARLTERDLQIRLAERLSDHKVPRAIRFVEEIPKGPTGKVQRIGLAGRLGLDAATGSAGSLGAAPAASAAYVAPRTPLETDLAAIWSEVLGLDRVGVTDDYFELGGDSILAAMIVTRIGERLGHRDLPLATFLWAPTVERYARGLEAGTWESASSALVPIQPEGSRRPFFFVHVDEPIMSLSVLRRTLDPDQPLYGLRAMGLEGGDLPPSLDVLADTFLEEVRAVQPEGPYYLGGYCSGGPVALEMARRLHEDGQAIGLLGLVDPRADRRHGLGWYMGRPAYYVSRARHHLRDRRFRRAVRGLFRWIGYRVTRPPADRPLEHDRYLDALAKTTRATMLDAFPGGMVVFTSRTYEVPRDLWEGLADHVTWERLPVDHETMFQGDQGAVFAARMSETLRATVAR